MSKIAFIYPGQGAQKAGMGKDFYENSPLARDIYDRASDGIYAGSYGDNLSCDDCGIE